MIVIKTFQDLQAASYSLEAKAQFITSAIADHEGSEIYQIAKNASQYAKGLNTTIHRYQKLLYKLNGEAVPDTYTANHKCARNFLNYYVTQETSYLLGNGVTFENPKNKEKFGKKFDKQIYRAVKNALIQSVSFVYFNRDHLEVFKLSDSEHNGGFVPLYDDMTGALMAGIRYWKVEDRNLSATLYEVDGLTNFTQKDGKLNALNDKPLSYKVVVKSTEVDGDEYIPDGNYSALPIIALYGNENHISELVGRQESIDCYDLIKSGFANDLDDSSAIYWTLQNAGGMDDNVSLAKFVERMKSLKAVALDDDTRAEAHTMEVPYQSREACLNRLEVDLSKDFMGLDIEKIVAGSVTATQIRAAYEALEEKTDELEMCLIDFFDDLFKLAEIDDNPTFTRSKIMNKSEEVQTILLAVDLIGQEEATRQICAILGISDRFDDIMKAKAEEDMNRFPLDRKEEVDGQNTSADGTKIAGNRIEVDENISEGE